MSSPTRLTTEESTSDIKKPVLIVDKEGILGKELILKLGKDTRVVYVSRSKPFLANEYLRNILYVPFINRFPTIPNGDYSLIFIFDNILSKIRELLPSFFEKAQKDKIPVIFITGLLDTDDLFLNSLIEKYSKIKVLVHGDIFDKELSLDQDAPINKFLYDAFAYQKLSVPGDGLGKSYPVYLEDVVSCILDATFGSSVSNEVFFVFPKHPPTAIGIARSIQKGNPEIKIDFNFKKEEDVTRKIPSIGQYLLEDNYALDEKIKKVVAQRPVRETESYDLEKYIKEKARYKKSEKNFLFPVLLFFVFLVILPFFSTVLFSLLGIFGFFQIQSSLGAGNIDSVSSWSNFSNVSFSVAKASYQPIYFEASAIGFGSKISSLGENINAGQSLSENVTSLVDAYKKISSVLTGKSSNPSSDFSTANLELSDALVSIKRLEQDRYLNSAISSKLRENEGLINLISSFQIIFPQLIGINDKRNYLVLFQNNMELRPTGGFIGSYGLLSLDNGKMSPLVISDVYDADGQLKGHVEPPFAIRRYLPSEHWYLRDSNFDFDFSKAASSSAFFLKTELGKNVDGVIGVNVSFVRDILKAIGGVHVPEYNENVDSDNFFKLTEAHSEKDFFPGSTQKKDFLGSVFRALQHKFETEKNMPYLSLANLFVQELRNKNVLLASSDSSIQSLFSINGWSSSLLDNRQISDATVNDYLAISEANLGINKVNYFVDRKISKNTIINDEGKVSSEVTISYDNKSDGSWPGGNYKNYLRIALPMGATISSVSIEGKEQKIIDAVTDFAVYEKKGFVPPDGLEIETTQEDGKQIYGFLINVAAGSKQTIVIDYVLSQKFPIDSPASSYNLIFLKQSGLDSVPFNFSFSYPQSQKIIAVSDGMSKENGSATFSKNIFEDQNLYVNFARQ